VADSRTERDARLDALEKATKEWASKERKRLAAEVEFLKKVKESSAAGSVGAGNVETAKALLVSSIGQFLSG